MSGYRAYEDASRFDSALDLSHSYSYLSHDDYEDSQTVAASSVIAPWSEYNTRLGPDHISPYAPSEWSSTPYTFADLGPLDYATQVFESTFSPVGQVLRYTSPDAATSPSCSPPPSPPLPLPWAAASSATASSPLLTSKHSDNNTIPCGQCSKEFTGTYRRGNLARHVRQKHVEAKGGPYTCTAEGCFRVFQRQDARLKHARSKHPELHLPPVQKRHGTEHYPTSHYVYEDVHVAQDLNYNVGQWLHAEQGFIGNHTSKVQHEVDTCAGVEQLPRAAQCVFTTLERNLDPTDYSRICDSFFTRWESIVQQLKDDQSPAYPVYAKVLEDIRGVVQVIDVAASSSCAASLGDYNSRVPHSQRTGPRGNGSSGLSYSTGITSQTDRVSKHSDRKSSLASGLGKRVLVAVADRINDNEGRKVDCPVYKHHIMHGTLPPCRGCCVGVMSQVRSHLNPSRAAGTHNGFPEFVEQCSRCKQDFIERQVYDDHKAASACEFQSQTRGDIRIPWARQYLALFPRASRIPVPWTNERGWLPDWILTQCRSPRANSVVSNPFLGERQSRNRSHSQTPPITNNPSDTSEYHTALGHVLHDVMNPTFTQPAHSPTPIQNHNRQSTPSLPTPFTGITGTNGQHWQNVLYSFETHQRTIREAATFLTPEQLGLMAMESELMLNISRGMYQQRQSQQTQVQIHPPTTYNDPSHQDGNPLYTTPMRPQRLPTSGHNQFVTPSTSTQPSSHGYDTGSSQHIDLTLTQPSSTSEHIDPRLLSPYSPTNRRRTSLPSTAAQDTLRLRRGVPSRLSLPDDPPSDDNDAQYHDSMRQHFRRQC